MQINTTQRITYIKYQIVSIVILFVFYLLFHDHNSLMKISGDNSMAVIVMYGFIGVISLISLFISIILCLLTTKQRNIIYSYCVALFAGFTTLWVLNDFFFIHKAYIAIDYVLHIILLIGFIYIVDREKNGKVLKFLDFIQEKKYLKDILIFSVLIICCYIIPDLIFERYVASHYQGFRKDTISASIYIRYIMCYACLLFHLVLINKNWHRCASIVFILFLKPSLIYLCAKMYLFDVIPLALYFGYSFGFSIISVIIYELTCKKLSKHNKKYRKLYEAELKEKTNK